MKKGEDVGITDGSFDGISRELAGLLGMLPTTALIAVRPTIGRKGGSRAHHGSLHLQPASCDAGGLLGGGFERLKPLPGDLGIEAYPL